MIFNEMFEYHNFYDIVALTDSDIIDDMIDSCLEIDKEFYDDEYLWDIENLKQSIRDFGEFCFVYIDKSERKVIGYSFWFPVKTDVFNNFACLKVSSFFVIF